MMTERIGFIGLGIMGRPMALNLLEAGFGIVVHSRSPGPVDELVAAGAERGADPEDVASRSDVVITMLPDTPDVELVLLGERGVVGGIRAGSLVIDMSTIRPLAAKGFAETFERRNVSMLDAPVSGGERGAIEGTLSIMVGGSAAALDRGRPFLEVMGSNVVHVGPAGAGQVAKACNQLVVAATIQAVAEALLLAKKAGVDPAKVREALLGGFAGSKILEVHGQRMLADDFTPGFRSVLHRKDARIVRQTAEEVGSPVPLFEIAAQGLERLVEVGRGELDHAALVTLLEDTAGVRVAETG
jgi:2-hydroxy-3-oxopropionate reductase